MEKFEMSFEELEGQHAELLPDRLEMRRHGRRRRKFVQDCDQATVFTGLNLAPVPNNIGGQNAICLSQ